METRADPMTTTTTVETTPAATEEAPTYRVQLRPRPRVTFDEDVVDNEHLGRKKSNKCCIFHKKRAFGESSSESGEDSEREHRKPHGKDCAHRKRKPASQRPTKPQPFVPSQDA